MDQTNQDREQRKKNIDIMEQMILRHQLRRYYQDMGLFETSVIVLGSF